jgi:riboflavin kinase/FMN adenylyltransferase
MRVVHDSSAEFTGVLAQVRPAAHSYVTIGVFDGVHRGHQHLITDMIEAAHSAHGIAVAVTFDPHPAKTLGAGNGHPFEAPPLLTTVEERVELLAALGLDALVVLPFAQATARTPAADFVEALVRHLNLAELWVGADFTLGYQREGDVQFLQRLGARRGFAVHIVEPLVWEGALVSSSRVRDALKAGDIPQATGCLGRPYRLAGVVVRGQGPGRGIEVPTVIVCPPAGRIIPAGGTYACLAQAEHLAPHAAVVSVNTHPASDRASQGHAPVVEVHVLDLDAELRDRVLKLDFVARLRDERGLHTPGAPMEQIHDDIARARVILGHHTAAQGAHPPGAW